MSPDPRCDNAPASAGFRQPRIEGPERRKKRTLHRLRHRQGGMRYQQPTPVALFEDIRLIDEAADISACLRFGYRVGDTRRPRHIVFYTNVGAVRLGDLKV